MIRWREGSRIQAETFRSPLCTFDNGASAGLAGALSARKVGSSRLPEDVTTVPVSHCAGPCRER
jgi:hypothetical protein